MKKTSHFRLWAHQAGSHNGQYHLPGHSRITPVEAARYLGVPNLIMVCYAGQPQAPFDPHAQPMQRQCELGWRWLNEDRIEGMIFLASCLCDLGIDTVEWTRQWIARVGAPRPGGRP